MGAPLPPDVERELGEELERRGRTIAEQRACIRELEADVWCDLGGFRRAKYRTLYEAALRRIAELQALEEEHRALNGRLRVASRDLAGALRVMLSVAKRCLGDGTMGREALEAEVAHAEEVLQRAG